jgi:hypothetical protein
VTQSVNNVDTAASRAWRRRGLYVFPEIGDCEARRHRRDDEQRQQ